MLTRRRPDQVQRDLPSKLYSLPKGRDGHGGGVFILVRDNITSLEEPNLNTDCEVIWTRIKTEGNKDLHIGCYYMPHREEKDIANLASSLDCVTAQGKNNKQVLLAGDFNCPDINRVE